MTKKNIKGKYKMLNLCACFFPPFCSVTQYDHACSYGQHSLDIINCNISILTMYMYQNISNVKKCLCYFS